MTPDLTNIAFFFEKPRTLIYLELGNTMIIREKGKGRRMCEYFSHTGYWPLSSRRISEVKMA